MAGELGGLETAEADVADPASVSALVEEGDVLVTTVGPFARWGAPAAGAATTAGAHYLDSTGEPPFIREVFERYGPAAEKSGQRDAHRLRLRLGAGQPGGRRSRSTARATRPRGSTSATSSADRATPAR